MISCILEQAQACCRRANGQGIQKCGGGAEKKKIISLDKKSGIG